MVKYLRSLFTMCVLGMALSANAQCPALSSTSLNANCATGTDGAINLTLTGGTAPFSFSWVGPSGFTAATEDISGLVPGIYTVTVTNPGCTQTFSDTVVQLPQVNATIAANGSTVFCPGDSVELEVTASGTNIAYQWFNDIILLPDTGNTIVVHATGNYQAIVTDTGFCPGTSGTIPVLVLATPNVNISPVDSVKLCTGSILSIVGFDDMLYMYQWWKNGAMLPGEDSSMLEVTTAGNYWVVITELGMCTDTSDTVTVTVHPLPVASISVITVGSVQKVVVTTPFAGYQWFHNNQLLVDSTNQYMTTMGSGTYYAIVTDANGCQDTTNVLALGTGVGSGPSPDMIQVHPNPATNVVYIDAPVKLHVTVSDMQGRVLSTHAGVQAVDISALSAGLYLLSIRDEDGVLVKSEKLVKE